jgi:hypothetical protein
MAKLLSLPRRIAILLVTFAFSLAQFVRAKPSSSLTNVAHPKASGYRVNRGLLFRFARADGGYGFRRHYVMEATGAFPFVRLVSLSSASSVPVPIALRALPSASAPARSGGLMHAALGGLTAPEKPSGMAKSSSESCGGGCGSCGGCASCGGDSCGSCLSCTSCGSCVSCGGGCSNCAFGFGNCGSNGTGCSSCASCLSCSSCICSSCSSCAGCGSCSSCAF